MTGYIYGTKPYRAVGSLVIAHRITGEHVHVYAGQFLPADTDPLQIDALEKAGLVAQFVSAPVDYAAIAAARDREAAERAQVEQERFDAAVQAEFDHRTAEGANA